MMPRRRNRGTVVFSLLAAAVVVIVAGYGLYLANMAGRLPWQEEPTRIPVTPFANLGGPGDDTDEAPPGTPITDSGRELRSLAVIPARLTTRLGRACRRPTRIAERTGADTCLVNAQLSLTSA